MQNVYLAIANPHGLLALLPEVPAAAGVAVYICRKFRRSGCFWVVLTTEVAHGVQQLLDDGDRALALNALQQQLLTGGAINVSAMNERFAA
jgi:hypothetical protein